MARPRKPVQHHKATGNFRPSRHGNVSLPVEIPPMPADLPPVAQATWNIVSEQLRRAGLVARIDLHALRLLCDSMDLYFQASDEVREFGVTLQQFTAEGMERRVVNPAVRVRSDSWRQVTLLLKQFGMSPAARTGIRIGDAGDECSEESKVAAILKLNVG